MGKRIVGCVLAPALACLAAGCADVQIQKTPVFAQIMVSEKSVVYVQIQGDELRTAMSVEGLQAAAPVKMHWSSVTCLEADHVTLPLPADQLPAGVTAVQANVGLLHLGKNLFSPHAPFIQGVLTVSRTDDQKAVWQYGTMALGVWAGKDAAKAPSIKSPNLDKLKAAIQAAPSNGKLAIGLRMMAGDAELFEVRKDGQPVQVKMVVTDASGKEIASKVGTLEDFGFS